MDPPDVDRLTLLERAADDVEVEPLQRRRIGRAQHDVVEAENLERGRHGGLRGAGVIIGREWERIEGPRPGRQRRGV